MFTSRTSVGVQERSASSSTVFVSEDTLCCCAWRRLDSRRDSICSWQARKQSCRRVQWKGGGRERERPKSPLERSQGKIPVSWQSKRNVTKLSGRAAGWKGGWEEQKHPTGWASLVFLQIVPCTAASLPVLFTALYKPTAHNCDFCFHPRNPSAAESAGSDAHQHWLSSQG